jgi:hypothetical protein
MGNNCCCEQDRYDKEVLEAEDVIMIMDLLQENRKKIIIEYKKLKSYMRDSNKFRENYYVI